MKHTSLASKYRPQTFEEMAGQDIISDVLRRAASEKRVASGYLFCGTRGVGKTTAARIFAKALNCENPREGEPCNQCSRCKKITAGIHPDVIEIDGASNNSVEDARSLRETIGFAPMDGNYKVFIIDEAHMLSKSAFNALLKTLEEPPKHAAFIFATTEIHKFPATILSRCQVYSFRHVQEETIVKHLKSVLGKEDKAYDEEAIRIIARRAAGSVRDSMSLLDQVLAYSPESVNSEHVRQVLGIAGSDAFKELFDALAEQDCFKTALFSKSLSSKEVDLGFFMRELASNLRSLFLLSQCHNPSLLKQFGSTDDEINFWEQERGRFSPGYLHAAWQMVVQNQRAIITNQEPAGALELLLLNLALLPKLLSSSHAAEPSVLSQSIAGAPTNASMQQDDRSYPPSSPASLASQRPSDKIAAHEQEGYQAQIPLNSQNRDQKTTGQDSSEGTLDNTEPPPRGFENEYQESYSGNEYENSNDFLPLQGEDFNGYAEETLSNYDSSAVNEYGECDFEHEAVAKSYSSKNLRNGTATSLSVGMLRNLWSDIIEETCKEEFQGSVYLLSLLKDLYVSDLSNGTLFLRSDAYTLDEEQWKIQRGIADYLYQTYKQRIKVSIELSPRGELQKRSNSAPLNPNDIAEFQEFLSIFSPICTYKAMNKNEFNKQMEKALDTTP